MEANRKLEVSVAELFEFDVLFGYTQLDLEGPFSENVLGLGVSLSKNHILFFILFSFN